MPVEGIILEPGPERPPGYEDGVFVSVPSDPSHIYYLDPEASREQGKLVFQVIDLVQAEPRVQRENSEEYLKQFEHLWQAPDVKRGGGATSETRSKHKGIVELS